MIGEPFKTETDLCSHFIGQVGSDWTSYAETAGFDILLVRGADGFQIGIQAKLRLNAAALVQALEGWSHNGVGPDARAVLVPMGNAVAGVAELANRLAVTVIRQPSERAYKFGPSLPTIAERYWSDEEAWHELCPTERCKLPAYVPDVAAGSSAPVQLTAWKIKAIKIAVLAEIRGVVTRADFKAIGIDIRRWIDSRWLIPGPDGFTVAGTWLRDQHPKVYEEIKADADKWLPKVDAATKLVRARVML